MDPQTLLALTLLSLELNALPGAVGNSPGYRKLYMMALDGRLRTVIINGRHFVPKADVPEIGRMLGMLPAQVERPTREHQVAAAEQISA